MRLKLIILLLVISGGVQAQNGWIRNNTSVGTIMNGLSADSSLKIPTGFGDPVLYTKFLRKADMFFDSTNHRFWIYNPKRAAWDSIHIGASNTTGWGLFGNSGTTAGTNFVGTTDGQDLVLKRNSTETFRLKSGGALQAVGYGGGAITGTAASYPAFDASGNLIETTSPYTGNNIYNSDGTLTGNRTVDAGGNYLYLVNSSMIALDGTKVSIGGVTNDSVVLRTDSLIFNISSKGAGKIAVSDAEGGISFKNVSSVVSTPTFQQTLTAGSTLSQNNSIDGGGYDYVHDNNNSLRLVSGSGLTNNSLVLDAGGNAIGLESTVPGGNSAINIQNTTGISMMPHLGKLYIDSLNYSADASDSMVVWRSDGFSQGLLGKRAIPVSSGGTVTGTGTLNYLPKWSSSTGLGDGLLYNSSTGIGLGTTSPNALFHIAGTAPASVGSGNGTSATKALTIVGANGGATSASSGTVSGGTGASATITAGNGGDITGTPGTGIGGTGGNVTPTAGDGGLGTTFGGTGGNFEAQAGNGGGGTSGGAAGYAALKAGNAGSTGNASGGNVYLTAGAKNGSGQDGSLLLGVSPSSVVRGNTLIGTITDDYVNKLQVAGNSSFAATNTTGNGLALANSSLTSGKLASIASTSTAKLTGATGLHVAVSGALSNASQTTYGAQISNTHTGTTETNVGLSVSASGATNNYGLLVPAGNVGIGTSAPNSLFSVGSTNGLRVDNSGFVAIGKAPSSSYPFQFLNTSWSAISTSPNANQLMFSKTDVSNNDHTWTFGMSRGGVGVITNDLLFANYPGTGSWFEAMRIQSATGNVGIGTTSPTSTLHTNASFATGYVAKTANYTATISDYTINCTANTFQVTLPTAVGITGRIYTVTNSDAAATITIGTTSSQTFSNVTATPTTLTIVGLGTRVVQSTNAGWILISSL